MNFYLGQKVVCVDDSADMAGKVHRHFIVGGELQGLRRGKVYTVRGRAESWMDGLPAIYLEEIVRSVDYDGSEPPYWAKRFRPLLECKTDISVFLTLLNPHSRQAKVLSDA